MDLGAFAQISELDELAKANGIDIPRLRGYRLMVNEPSISPEEIKEIEKEQSIWIVQNLCKSEPFWNPNSIIFTFSYKTTRNVNYYLVRDSDGNYIDIRWDRIHGKKRKILKFEIKKAKHRIKKQFDIWNKYVGQPDVLYIHSRIGGNNWAYFNGNELMKQPWFIERVDDYFDRTYCDIFARIGSKLIDHLKDEYHKSDVVMTEFLRSFNPELPDCIQKELLEWAGEEEYE